MIIDIAGNASLSRLRRALTPTGTAVLVGGEDAGRLTGMSRQLRALVISPFSRQRLTLRVPKESASDLERLTALIEGGQVRRAWTGPTPSSRRRGDAAPRGGRVRGKVAIAI